MIGHTVTTGSGKQLTTTGLDARHVVDPELDLLKSVGVLERGVDLGDRAVGGGEAEQQLARSRVGTDDLAAVLLLTGVHEHVLDIGGLDETDRHRRRATPPAGPTST